ncbi:hypothetical protein [Breoghania sp.]|uniref:hypothetical protein n=1 Tax=Breoghania sp. TaxID=2065378 RepID=UPI002AA73A0D|nr:hypothetical protein [Breoghania sp.]
MTSTATQPRGIVELVSAAISRAADNDDVDVMSLTLAAIQAFADWHTKIAADCLDASHDDRIGEIGRRQAGTAAGFHAACAASLRATTTARRLPVRPTPTSLSEVDAVLRIKYAADLESMTDESIERERQDTAETVDESTEWLKALCAEQRHRARAK